jgi:hypothetical protein
MIHVNFEEPILCLHLTDSVTLRKFLKLIYITIFPEP